MLENIMSIYDNMPTMMKKLKKDKYEEFFKEFNEINAHFFQDMLNEINTSTDKELISKELSCEFVDQVEDKFANNKGKIQGSKQADLNMFMIYYVFPTILNIENEDATLLVENICKSWANHFDDSNISYTTYDKIHSSFRQRIFGIF